jgi:hypothetical protein
MRARLLKPGLFLNERLAEVSPLGRLLFPALWCLADREGRLEDRPKRIKAEALPYDNADISALLDELEAGGFIRRYEVDEQRLILVDPKDCLGQIPLWQDREWYWLRQSVFERDNFTCRYCGRQQRELSEPLHCDHIVPRSKGGSDNLTNLATACRNCNLSKHARTPEEWGR